MMTQSTGSYGAEMSTGPVLVPRKPAAYLTYNTLTPSSDSADSQANLASQVMATPTHPKHQESMFESTSMSRPPRTLTPAIATKPGSRSTASPNDVGETTRGGELPPQKTAEPGSSSPDDGSPEKGDDNSGPDTPQQDSQPAPARPGSSQMPSDNSGNSGSGFQNIESAIGGLASQASALRGTSTEASSGEKPHDNGQLSGAPRPQTTVGPSLGNLWSAIQSIASHATFTLPAREVASVDEPASSSVSQQDTAAGESENAHDADNDPTATGPAAPGVTTNGAPIFVIEGKTLGPGDAATFGGNPLSQLPGRDGVVIDGSQTLHVSDGQATTIQQSGGNVPITVSRSGSVLIVNGKTLRPDQQFTVGQTTVSLAKSTGVLYVNGAATTMAGPSITVGGTVYTAPADASTSGGDLGGYIYSGIEGSGTSGSSRSESTSDTGVTPSTGIGSRSSGRDPCVVAGVVFAFWLL